MDNQSESWGKEKSDWVKDVHPLALLTASISLHGVEGILGLSQTNAIDAAVEFDGFQFVARQQRLADTSDLWPLLRRDRCRVAACRIAARAEAQILQHGLHLHGSLSICARSCQDGEQLLHECFHPVHPGL